MEKFTDVTVAAAANIYFDGKVTSRTLEFADGSRKTLGIMLPGDYEFSTSQEEKMEITVGDLLVKLPGQVDWQQIRGGDHFMVPANASFQLQVRQVTDYICSYY